MDKREFLKSVCVSTAALGSAACTKTANTLAGPSYSARELAQLDTIGQAQLFKAGDVSALELVDGAIERIEALNPSLNCVCYPAFDYARTAARNAKATEGELAGVPFLMKTTNSKQGMPATSAATFLDGTIGTEDEQGLARAEGLGLIYTGQATAPEFALLPSTQSLKHGITRNPWALDRNTAGSSGGSAAAVAAGMVAFATADDGAGSTRMPAACCGVIGFKYSRGREQSNMTGLGHIVSSGCETRSVRDQALFLSAMEVKQGGMLPPVGVVDGPSAQRLRIAYSTQGIVKDFPNHPEVSNAIANTAKMLADLGHRVEESRFAIDGEQFWYHFMVYWTGAGAEVVAAARSVLGREPTAQEVDVWNRGLAADSKNYGEDAYAKARAYFEDLRASYHTWMQGFDVQLTPAISTPPDLLTNQDPINQPYGPLKQAVMEFCNFTPMHNGMGLPSMSLPLSMSNENLPIGNLFSGAAGSERTLLQLAFELEQASPWKDRWAPHSVYR